MRRATPFGLDKPWATNAHLQLIADALEDGIPFDDIVEVIEGAARLVVVGRQKRKFWRLENLFGTPGLSWWRAEIQEYRFELEEAREREEKRAAAEQRYESETLAMAVGDDCNVVPLHPAIARIAVQWYEATGRPPPAKQLGLPVDG
jgi:hypothetical protein